MYFLHTGMTIRPANSQSHQAKRDCTFSHTKLYTSDTEDRYFSIRKNGQEMCNAVVDFLGTGGDDNGTPSCGTVILLSAGKIL